MQHFIVISIIFIVIFLLVLIAYNGMKLLIYLEELENKLKELIKKVDEEGKS